jgi:hypothetical protein
VWQDIFQWISDRSMRVLVISSALSIAMVVMSVLALPWLIARLPAEYFARVSRPDLRETDLRAHPVRRILKNVLGGVLAIAGFAMLFLPGQGLVTLLVALTLLEFPGKARLERRLIENESVFSALNWIRRKVNKEPFIR